MNWDTIEWHICTDQTEPREAAAVQKVQHTGESLQGLSLCDPPEITFVFVQRLAQRDFECDWDP